MEYKVRTFLTSGGFTDWLVLGKQLDHLWPLNMHWDMFPRGKTRLALHIDTLTFSTWIQSGHTQFYEFAIL